MTTECLSRRRSARDMGLRIMAGCSSIDKAADEGEEGHDMVAITSHSPRDGRRLMGSDEAEELRGLVSSSSEKLRPTWDPILCLSFDRFSEREALPMRTASARDNA